jgi:hypothetical protein
VVSLLLVQRTKNYAFSFDKALNMKGNSAVFLLYALARLEVCDACLLFGLRMALTTQGLLCCDAESA